MGTRSPVSRGSLSCVVRRETLKGGAHRLVAEKAVFVIHGVRPGVLLIRAGGVDEGQFGSSITDELSAELERLPVQTALFFHALGVESVGLSSRALWTSWLEHHRARLRGLHMLLRTPAMQLVVDIAGHYSRAPLITYTDPAVFLHALRDAAQDPRLGDPTEDEAREATPCVAVIRQEGRGVVSLSDGLCAWYLRPVAPDVMWLRVVGTDHGTLTSAVFDEIRTRLNASRRLRLFVDLRGAVMPGLRVTDLWAAWFAAHRPRLEEVMILSTQRPVSVTASIVGWRSRTGDLIRQESDPLVFAAALRRYAPSIAFE